MATIYQIIFKWALSRWRNSVGNKDIYRKKSKVSTHALMRYAERIDGYDFDRVEKEILEAKQKIEEYGGNGKINHNGVIYVVKDGLIVTCYLPNGGANSGLVYAPLGNESGGRWTF